MSRQSGRFSASVAFSGYRKLRSASAASGGRQERLAFAKAVLRLTKAELREKLSLSMDGVVLAVPPKDATDRANYCAHGAGHMWRKRGEAGTEKLAGDDPYPQQIPQTRIVPLWGVLSEGGFSVITFHNKRKLTSEEWCHVVRRGKLTAAIRALEPSKADGPWKVLADNESFLHTAASRRWISSTPWSRSSMIASKGPRTRSASLRKTRRLPGNWARPCARRWLGKTCWRSTIRSSPWCSGACASSFKAESKPLKRKARLLRRSHDPS